MFKNSTPDTPAIVYCNDGLCNPNKPKLFEYSEHDDGCSTHSDIICPTNHDRLSSKLPCIKRKNAIAIDICFGKITAFIFFIWKPPEILNITSPPCK